MDTPPAEQVTPEVPVTRRPALGLGQTSFLAHWPRGAALTHWPLPMSSFHGAGGCLPSTCGPCRGFRVRRLEVLLLNLHKVESLRQLLFLS